MQDAMYDYEPTASENTLEETYFYFVHINTFCYVHSTKRYLPAEIAVCRFNLYDGILPENVYHIFCKPGPIPVGYAYELKQTRDSSHNITYPEGKASNLKEIFEDLIDVLSFGLNDGDYIPPLYTFGKNRDAIQEIIDNFCSDYSNVLRKNRLIRQDRMQVIFLGSTGDFIRIYPLENLFYNLKRNANQINQMELAWTLSFPILELERDVYEYTVDIGCDFHEEHGLSNHCSKSYVVRWAYTILDYCCQDYNIPLIPGQHVPKKSSINSTTMQEADLTKCSCNLKDTPILSTETSTPTYTDDKEEVNNDIINKDDSDSLYLSDPNDSDVLSEVNEFPEESSLENTCNEVENESLRINESEKNSATLNKELRRPKVLSKYFQNDVDH